MAVLFCFLLIGCNGNDTNDANTPNDEETNVTISDEEKVRTLFLTYAQHDDDGTYRFRKVNYVDNTSFAYNFAYSPAINSYSAYLFITSSSTLTMHDYSAVAFTWGQFEKGLFYAYHELAPVAKVEFEYSNLSFINNSIGASYSYIVRSNSFVNLTEKSEIDAYAARGFEVLQQAINFINLVFSSHNLSVALF